MVEIRRRKHYSNLQSILLLGEGNFSFSSALATAFGGAPNIVATSLESKEKVYGDYDRAHSSIWNLQSRGATAFFGGGELSEVAIKKNNKLLREAEKYGLYLKKSVRFRKTDYLGYMNVRGSGDQINRTFYLGESKTYMFSNSKYAF
ncbi:hypothetical protein SUGI_0086700 [Cryptomeria japonica]|nr:hypothetical protein SUGI_0086700 [Cryptomeria japonica]